MEYRDLTIDLQSREGGGFEARIAEAPQRYNPRVKFPEPVDRKELDLLHNAFDGPRQELVAKAALSPVRTREIGGQLFAALFQEEVGEHFQRCRDACCHDGAQGLRVRLRFRTDDPEAGYLAALPWEWMIETRAGEYLAVDRCTPVVREIATPRAWRGPLEVEPPLRILVVDAAPTDRGELALKCEIERMEEALETLVNDGEVELLQLSHKTPEGLRDAVFDDRIHVLHFMGHGGYRPDGGNGAIVFEKEDGTADPVDGEALATFLKRSPDLRLVVLNACKSARYTGRKSGPWSVGVASAVLEQAGVPAVVANQYTISDASAIAWSAAFYGGLAKGWGVDEAVTEARLRLWRNSVEWATPVLFLNGPDGRILVPKAPGRRSTTPVTSQRPSRPEPREVRLGVRSFDGYGRDMTDRNDEVLELVPYFDGRYIKDKASWQERIFPELRDFLARRVVEGQPLGLDFAAHSSIAFAAGWLLEPKSGLDVKVRQRISGETEIDWHPKEGAVPEGPLWAERQDVVLDPAGPDVAVALSISQPNVAEHVEAFVRARSLPVGRIVDASVPEPGPRSIQGGAHALRLAQTLLPRLQPRQPHERGGRVHVFAAAPNALVFYLGQLSTALGKLVLYEFPFRAEDAYGRYQQSIELPPHGAAPRVPENW
jgi:CBASS immunity sensor of nucleotide second messenger signals/CHAT domain-containing protein